MKERVRRKGGRNDSVVLHYGHGPHTYHFPPDEVEFEVEYDNPAFLAALLTDCDMEVVLPPPVPEAPKPRRTVK